MFRQRYGTKYGNLSSMYDGIQYHSKREAREAQDLDLMIKAKEIVKWERQVKISLDVNDYHIANYFVDFKLYFPDGSVEYREVKGYETDVWKMKWKLFEALYSGDPMVKLLIVR